MQKPIYLFIFFICFLCEPRFLAAQNPGSSADTPTQRLLPLPQQGGPSDLSEQAAMLQQLQRMLSLADVLQSQELQNSLNEQDKESLSSLFQDYLNQQPPSAGQTDPLGSGQQAQENLLQDQARKLLEKFSQDRELPQPSQRGGGPSLLPPQSNPSGTPPRTRNDSRGPNGQSPIRQDQNLGAPPQSTARNPAGFDQQNQIPPDFNPFEDTPATKPPQFQPSSRGGNLPPSGQQSPRNEVSNPLSPNASNGSADREDQLQRDTQQMQDLLKELQSQAERLRNQGTASNPADQQAPNDGTKDSKPKLSPEALEKLNQLIKDPKIREAIRNRTAPANPGLRQPPSFDPRNLPGQDSSANQLNGEQFNSPRTGRVPPSTAPRNRSTLNQPRNRLRPSSTNRDPTPEFRDRPIDANLDQSLGSQAPRPDVPDTFDKTPTPTKSSKKTSKGDRTWGEWISDLTAGSNRDELDNPIKESDSGGNQGSAQQPTTEKTAEKSPPAAGSGESKSSEEVKTTVERFGLGEALRRIVKETLDEEGEDTESWLGRGSKQTAHSSSGSSRSGGNPTGQSGNTGRQNSGNSKSPFNEEQLGQWAEDLLSNSPGARPNTPSGTTKPTNQSAQISPNTPNQPGNSPGVARSRPNKSSGKKSDESIGKLAQDFWKAISSSPKNRPPSSQGSNSVAPVGGSNSGQDWNFGWQQILIVGAVIAGALMLWMVYRPEQSEEEIQESAAKAVARQLMATGIRTRADIITAFHALVLRRPYSASNWWTHWYVADRVNEITPQRENAIADLTQLYEQARYMPPQSKLSPEEIAKAEAAFRTFATEG